MTVAKAKETIAAAMEDLRKQGVLVHGVRLEWLTEVALKDEPKLDSAIRCKVHLEAEL